MASAACSPVELAHWPVARQPVPYRFLRRSPPVVAAAVERAEVDRYVLSTADRRTSANFLRATDPHTTRLVGRAGAAFLAVVAAAAPRSVRVVVQRWSRRQSWRWSTAEQPWTESISYQLLKAEGLELYTARLHRLTNGFEHLVDIDSRFTGSKGDQSS